VKRGIGGGRRASAVGALGGLAVSAFVLGAMLAGPPQAPAPRPATDADRAPGRAALGPAPTTTQDVSPASESSARDVAALPTATPGRRRDAGGPARLSVRVTPPDAPFTSDQPVRFRVRWSDGSGRYAGLTEDWGDGTAASSVQVVSCDGAAGPHGGELTSAHRFPAGRFRVSITVVTAECDGRTESRTGEVTIDVRAPGRTPGPPSARPDRPYRPEQPAQTRTGPRPEMRSEPESGAGVPSPEPSETSSPSGGPTGTPSSTPSGPAPLLPDHLVRTAEADRTDSDTP